MVSRRTIIFDKLIFGLLMSVSHLMGKTLFFADAVLRFVEREVETICTQLSSMKTIVRVVEKCDQQK